MMAVAAVHPVAPSGAGSGPAPAPATPPLGAGEFAALMAALGPFERGPALAVAVSGGPDSLALCLLAADWARARGGAATGLTVDHGLREESAAEAAAVAGWLAARGVPHVTLPWHGPKPATGIQAAARAARYGLLCAWCRTQGVPHLLLGHHRDDQAETVLLRRARGSGPDGLAAMAAVREVEGLRLLRPLLPVPKARLRATLEARGQPWLDDPGNCDPAFTRSRLRRPGAAADGDGAAALAEEARRHGLRRREAEGEVAAALARWARPHPAGFVELDRRCLTEPEPEIARRALARALCAVAGRAYPPRGARLNRLLRELRDPGDPAAAAPFRARTLHGCRVLARGRGGGRLLICREPAAIGGGGAAAAVALPPGGDGVALWDGRFRVRYRAAGVETGAPTPPLTVCALGRDGAVAAAVEAVRVPAPVRPGLPALWRGDRLVAIPHLGFDGGGTSGVRVELAFRPAISLAGPPFDVNGVASGAG